MADLVIKISEEDYERLKEYKKVPFNSLTSRVYEAIANGAPLPKDMIDADKVKEGINKLLKEPGYQHEGEDWRNGLIMAEDLIYDALTIIEADKED